MRACVTALGLLVAWVGTGGAVARAQDDAPLVTRQDEPRLYGDRGTLRLGVGLGLGSGGGGLRYLAGADVGYFVVPRVAPGVEALVTGGTGVLTTAQVLGNLTIVPLRTAQMALTISGRAGRLFIAEHANLWAVGGGGGLIFFTGSRVGIQVVYQVLRLSPGDDCADLQPSGCTISGLAAGVVAAF